MPKNIPQDLQVTRKKYIHVAIFLPFVLQQNLGTAGHKPLSAWRRGSKAEVAAGLRGVSGTGDGAGRPRWDQAIPVVDSRALWKGKEPMNMKVHPLEEMSF